MTIAGNAPAILWIYAGDCEKTFFIYFLPAFCGRFFGFAGACNGRFRIYGSLGSGKI